MKKIVLLILASIFAFAYKIDAYKWQKGDRFYLFLQQNSLPISIYYNLPNEIKRKVRNIQPGSTIFLLKDNNKIKQALFPIDANNQLQIIKKDNKYTTRIVPIFYDVKQKEAKITIDNFLSYDIYKATHLRSLAAKISDIFGDKINFRTLPKGSTLSVLYQTKSRYGKVKDVKVLFASFEIKGKVYNAFLNPYDGRYYDENGRSLKGMFLAAPLRYRKISSYFGRRFHPILHKWRMHDGIDYVNRVGTPIHSVADGIVIYKGWLGGYGKTIKIRHKNGYITLYGHLRSWPRRIYVGKRVRQGDVIGYLGNTGLSTGPHLHFGVMRYGRWINPLKIKRSAKTKLYGRAKKRFLAYIQKFIKENNIALK